MQIDEDLAARIEAFPRSVFRATVNRTRRSTLAIGALILAWGQFDSSLGWYIKEFRELHQTMGFSGLLDEHPGDQSGQLRLLRRFLVDCAADPDHVKAFDRIRTRLQAASELRDDIVHGAFSFSSFSESEEDLYVMCIPARKPRRTAGGVAPAEHEFLRHRVSKIFAVADDLYSAGHELASLIRVIQGLDPLNPLEDLG